MSINIFSNFLKKVFSNVLVLFVFCFFGTSYLQAKTLTIPRTDGSRMQVYIEVPNKDNFPVLVAIHGSVCDSSWSLFQGLQRTMLANGIGIATIEKYGLSETTIDCPQSYLQNNTIPQRIHDHLQVVKLFRNNLRGWNGKIAWVGGSEGGQVASLVAPLVPETSAVVMLAAGGGLTMAEELPLVFKKLLRRNGASQDQIAEQIRDIQDHYLEIKTKPTWKKEWLSDGKKARNTYKYWNSILWVKALPLLETLQVPIYIAHGTEDTSSAYESSKIIADRFAVLGKSNLVFKTYIGLEHNFSDLQGVSHKQEVLNEAVTWVISVLKNQPSTNNKMNTQMTIYE